MSQKHRLSKWIMTFMTMIMLVALVVSCAPAPATEAPKPEATEAPAVEEPAAPAATEAPAAPAATEAPAAPAGDGKFTIGISNPFISSEYRTQMIQELKDVNAEYMAAGVTNELVIESADTDVAGQIQQLQNLMSKNVDAILVNPGDAQGLNATLSEAIKAGILVMAIDQELDVDGIYNVGHNQKEWAMTSAKWLAEKLQEGNVVEIEGFPGHPANEYRMSGVDEVFADFPGIKVLARETGKWDEATGQQVMSNFLAGFPGQIDGVWTQDGMAIGALQAVMAANPPEWPIMVGEGRCQYLKLWEEVKQTQPDFESIGVANAPGVNATGLRIAINILQGKEVDKTKLSGQFGTSFIIPVPVVVTGENFQEWLDFCADKPDQFLLDGIMTEEEVLKEFFVQPEGAVKTFTIGISNPFISSEYRTQMIQELKDINAEYMAAGVTNELVIESADTDVAGQIQQLQNLMSKKVDAILVNPGDAQGLNATLEEAIKSGILVMAIDQELDVDGIYNVGHNQKEWAMTSAKWLAEKLQEGNVVEIEGFPGHPANEYRMSGVDEVFAGFPGINVLARETGKWDEATGQQVMSNFLAGFPGQIDGVWTQDGMAIGALQAVMAANPPEWPIMVGEGRCQYLKLWEEVKQTQPDFEIDRRR